MDSRDRAQSEVIGTVLLIGLTITAVGATVAIGSVALDDAQTSADVQRVEGAMTQVDSKTSLVAHGGSTSQRVRLDPGSTANARIDGDAGRMRIEVETEDGDVEARNVTLGAVVYERGDDRVAYQGGGVWRATEGGSWMVSPPEFHYRGDTLTLPLVTIDGENGRFRDSAVVTRNASRPDQLFPNENVSNPLLGGNVTVTVESEYAQAWGQFFESRTEANVTRLADDEVEVRLRTETTHPTLDASVSAVGRSTLDTGGINTLYADSYDSRNGAYPGRPGANDSAVVQTDGEFRLTAGGGGNTDSIEIRGDLVAESYNIPPGQSDKLNVTGERRIGGNLDDVGPVSGEIAAQMNRIRGLSLDAGPTLDESEFEGDDETIRGNTYVSDGLEVSDGSTLRIEGTDGGTTVHVQGGLDVGENGRVVIDSADGDVEVLLEGDLSLQTDGAIDSVGGGRNGLYVDGGIDMQDAASIEADGDTLFELYNTDEIDLSDEARIAADGGAAPNLWLYSTAGEIEIEGDEGGGVAFSGVLYAPASDVELEDRMTLNGSFTSASFGFDDADLELHYDEALRGYQPFGGSTVPVVSHLHVSRHRVVIESD